MGDISTRISALSPEKRALLLKRLREPASAAPPPRLAADPVAILGMACRFPGGAVDPASFWRVLRTGTDAIREVPSNRWDAAALFDSDPSAPGKTTLRQGGFLDDIEGFDASFFGISPREATRMDPKHRLLLEVAWEALDDAGRTRARLAGSRTGVFVAVYQSDWSRLAISDRESIDAYSGTGAQQCLAANRISYLLDLRGPSLVVDTACSSSLVAVHLACRSLLARECDLAIAGAVSLVLLPEECIAMSKLGMLAGDGRCKTFDARADGFGRGEGAGAIVLARLSDALAAGDDALALVRGTAVNQDGRTNGLTAPNGLAQQDVIRRALDDAGAAPEDIGYVETHGTGTPLGDPIEVEALAAVLGAPRADGGACALGAVKTNVGHLEAAAGMAGLIKAVLALRNHEIPPNLHLQEVNPRLPLDGTRFVLPAEPLSWSATKPRLAGVSSFGMGGTNAHVIVGEEPAIAPAVSASLHANTDPPATPQLVLLSAHSLQALRDLAAAHRARARGADPAAPVADLAAALALRRTHHEHRLAVTARSQGELAERLDAFLRGEDRPGTSSGRAVSGARRGLVFVFPGQGAQWMGMGRDLLANEPAFQEAIARCDRAISASLGWSLAGELAAPEATSCLARIEILQPVLFGLQVALAALLRSWGIEPDAVVGHSLGEVAAAHVAGALDLDDAVRVIGRRSLLLARLRGTGAMASVELDAEHAEEAISRAEGVAVAAYNGPSSTVLTGETGNLERLLAELEARGVLCRRIQVDVASHSPAVDALEPELLAVLADIHPRSGAIPITSTVTGATTGGADLDASYWARNLRRPVRFWPAAERLAREGHEVFVELGPHPSLLPALEQGLRKANAGTLLLPALRRDEEGRAVLLGSLGALWARGLPVRWEALFPGGARRVELPAYPWQRERMPLPVLHERSAPRGHHPLLGARIDLAHAPGMEVWQAEIDPAKLPFLGDHRVGGAVVLPGTATVELALAAAMEGFGGRVAAIEGVRFDEPVFLEAGEPTSIQVLATADPAGTVGLVVHARTASSTPWTVCSRATLRLGSPPAAPRSIDVAAIRARCPDEIAGRDLYASLAARGNRWGPAFQGIVRLHRGEGESLAEVSAPAEIAADLRRYRLHPALFDAFGQTVALLHDEGGQEIASGPTVLAGMDRVIVHGELGARMWGHLVRREDPRKDHAAADLVIFDGEGRVAVEILGLRLGYLEGGAGEGVSGARLERWLHQVRWERLDEGSRGSRAPAGGVLVVGDGGGVAERFAEIARGAGERVEVISAESTRDLGEAVSRTLARSRVEGRDDDGDPSASWDVLHLAALDAAPPADASATATASAALEASDAALRVIQALLRAPRRHRLFLVTRGAVDPFAGADITHPAQAPLWGLGRVLAAEHPEQLGGLLDLPPSASAAESAALLHQALADNLPLELALRPPHHLVPRLAHLSPGLSTLPLRLPSDRAYLITGGLGDLGLLVARRLVALGARHLVLLGRSALPPRIRWRDAPASEAPRISAVRELESLGASVHLASLDIGDDVALDAFLTTFAAEGRPPIRGVVHAAGVHLSAPLASLDRPSLEADFHAKIRGAWALHRAFGGDLDFFVLFSSAATLLGSPFLGSYAAANSFLDALAHHRRSRGQCALSIDWGFWGEVGMVARGEREHGRSFTPRGLTSFSPAEGLDVLERLLASALPARIAVIRADWRTFQTYHQSSAAAPLLSDLVIADSHPPSDLDNAAVISPPLTREALFAAAPEGRADLIETYLRRRLANVLRLPPTRVDLDQPFIRMGLDSLMAVELKNRIEADLGLTVPIVDVLACAGVHSLAAQLDGMTAGDPEAWEEISL